MAPLQSHGRQNHMAPHRHLTPPIGPHARPLPHQPETRSAPATVARPSRPCLRTSHPSNASPALPLPQRSTPIATIRMPSDSIHGEPQTSPSQPAGRRPWTAEARCRFPGASQMARHHSSSPRIPTRPLPTSPLRTSAPQALDCCEPSQLSLRTECAYKPLSNHALSPQANVTSNFSLLTSLRETKDDDQSTWACGDAHGDSVLS